MRAGLALSINQSINQPNDRQTNQVKFM